MSNQPKIVVNLTLYKGGEAELGFYPHLGLVMLHADCISAQWGIDDFVPIIQVCSEDHYQLGLDTHLGSKHPNVYTPNYQSFFFTLDSYERVIKFFGDMRFPMDRCVTLSLEQFKAFKDNQMH